MDYESALIEQNRLLGDTIFAAAPNTPIPTCPGWSMLQLLRHVGRGDRWAAHIINTRASADLDPRTVPEGRPPDDVAGARAWLAEGPRILLDAVAGIGPAEIVATFLGLRPARWWTRRRLHEATVHRADAALASGQRYTLDPDLAADGVDEWLARLAVQIPLAAVAPLSAGERLTLSATDTGEWWTVTGRTNGISWLRTPAATAAEPSDGTLIRGPAVDLLLALTRRHGIHDSGLTLRGDELVWQNWLERTPL
jgi:uncharacterized protein (TIGR03083 family)